MDGTGRADGNMYSSDAHADLGSEFEQLMSIKDLFGFFPDFGDP